MLSAVVVLFAAFKNLRVFEKHIRDCESCKNTSSIDVGSDQEAGSAIIRPEIEFDIADNDEQEPEFEEGFDIVENDEHEFEEENDIHLNMSGRSAFFR